MNNIYLLFFLIIPGLTLGQLPHGFSPSLDGKLVSKNGFTTEVRKKDSNLCFETNSLIIRSNTFLAESEFSAYGKLEKHQWIPNMYTLESNVHNKNELIALREKLISEFNIEVFFNQVFTLNTHSNDPNFNRQWALENMGGSLHYNGTPGADMSIIPTWQITTGSGVKVAVLDSGVDTLHLDLIQNILPGFDGFGDSIQDTHGFPTPNFSSDGHGTACAGIVAATKDNAIGTAGIAPDAKIIPVRIFYYLQYSGNIGIQPFTSTLGLLNGAAYAWRIAKCDIMSTSAGLSPLFIQALQIDTQIVNDEIDSAYNQGRNGLGVSMFFSAGNDDINDVLWPGNLQQTIAVGASDMCDKRKSPSDCSGENWGSTYGYDLDFVAPGVKIATTDMTGTNGFSANGLTLTFNGTSAACPNAAGVAALLISANPNLTTHQVRQIMSWTCDKIPYAYDSLAAFGTWNLEVGYGRLNAFEAVSQAINTSSITENSNSLISFGPNPASENAFIRNNTSEKLEIIICDQFGRTSNIILQANEQKQMEQKAGVYWILFNGTWQKWVWI